MMAGLQLNFRLRGFGVCSSPTYLWFWMTAVLRCRVDAMTQLYLPGHHPHDGPTWEAMMCHHTYHPQYTINTSRYYAGGWYSSSSRSKHPLQHASSMALLLPQQGPGSCSTARLPPCC